jgi:ferredoxin--NADP+ reductase
LLESAGARTKRNLDILRDFAAREGNGKPKRLELRFCASPVQILGEGKVEAIQIVRNSLVMSDDGAIKPVPTEEVDVIPCGLVLRSVGYRGVALPGMPFDERRGVIPNEQGRVTGQARVYAAGWIKRGPSGVIGTNKKDAAETCDRLLEDAAAGVLQSEGGELEDLLRARGVDFVEYAGWQAIDEHERALGEPLGRPRVKLTSWDELLAKARELDSAP